MFSPSVLKPLLVLRLHKSACFVQRRAEALEAKVILVSAHHKADEIWNLTTKLFRSVNANVFWKNRFTLIQFLCYIKLRLQYLSTESRDIRNNMIIQGNLTNLCVSESYLPSWILVNSRNHAELLSEELPFSQVLLLLWRLTSSSHVSVDDRYACESSFWASEDKYFSSPTWRRCHLRDYWIRAQH
jgi:hypothetical protein